MIRIKRVLLGGFPCTEFSIAQKVKRINKIDFTATEFIEFHNSTPQWWLHISEFEKQIGEKLGIPDYQFALGLQLFFNCIAALDRMIKESNREQVYYLFENVSSMKKEIKEVMEEILSKLYGGIMIEINSSLVSGQNRKRIYFTNAGKVEQPEDRGILLSDILESGVSCRNEKSYCLDANYYKGGNLTNFNKQSGQRMMVAEPVGDSKGKSYCLTANYANGPYPEHTLSKGVRSMVAEPVRIAITRNVLQNELHDSKQHRVYEVNNGLITIKDKQYPVKLSDGYYIIRKLTVAECCRLQTLPDDYCKAVSNSQAYKGLGNGWTAEVIIHILKHMNIPLDEKIEVLSMYDGIGTGRYCFDKMGYKNIKYYAYEIDKYAKMVSNDNYPDIVQCGDAFQVRDENWSFEGLENIKKTA